MGFRKGTQVRDRATGRVMIITEITSRGLVRCAWTENDQRFDGVFSPDDLAMLYDPSYWGIQCKTCSENVVLGIEEETDLGDCLTFLQPGSFVCVHGHRHEYDQPDLVHYLETNGPVNRAEIVANRSRYRRSTI
jgi:uncharacterized protein YodC (DUF2158 family)